jgi:hypothetical protein
MIQQLRGEIDAALKEVGERHGITIKAGNGHYGATGDLKLVLTPKTASGETQSKEELDYKQWHAVYNLPVDGLGKRFLNAGTEYTICGMKPSSRSYPVLGRRGDGRVFKFPVSIVLGGLR